MNKMIWLLNKKLLIDLYLFEGIGLGFYISRGYFSIDFLTLELKIAWLGGD